MKILGIEHVAVALPDAGDAVDLFGEILGIGERTRETIADQLVVTDIFDTGRGKVELLSPTSGDSPISKFLNQRGKGLHHIALEVDNIDAWLEHLKSIDVELIDEQARIGAEGNRIAFLHPRSTAGILIELCQKP